jgi:hypothetical protein
MLVFILSGFVVDAWPGIRPVGMATRDWAVTTPAGMAALPRQQKLNTNSVFPG